jgi:DNA ligase-1
MTLTEMLSSIEHEPSTNQKVQLARQYAQDKDFYRMVRYTYDPYMIFNIRKLPQFTSFDPKRLYHNNLRSMFDILEQLAMNDCSASTLRDWLEYAQPELITIFQKIITKNLDIGMGKDLFNCARPNWIPTFGVQLCEFYQPNKLAFPCYVQPKIDGVRCIVIVQKDGIKMVSRYGRPLNKYKSLLRAMEILPSGFVYDGEIWSPKGFQATTKRENFKDVHYTIFDMLPLAEWQSRTCLLPLNARLERLNNLRLINPLDTSSTEVVNTEKEIFNYYDIVLEAGGEGLVIKNPYSYYNYRRSYQWMKLKQEFTDTVPIVGFKYGEGKRLGKCGALIVEYKGTRVAVGSGLTDTMVDKLIVTDDNLIMFGDKNLYDVKIKISHSGVTEDGSLRHPRFVRNGHDFIYD